MHLARVVVNWSGPSVKGLAVNVLHFAYDGGEVNIGALYTAYQNLAGAMPTGVAIVYPTVGDVIEDSTGELVGTWTGVGAGPTFGGASAAAAAGVGSCISWSTGSVVNGRRLRGRTFLSPLSVAAYEADGTLTTDAVAKSMAVAAGIRAMGGLMVWHRPTAPGAADGMSDGVLGHKVTDRVSSLRSRRS